MFLIIFFRSFFQSYATTCGIYQLSARKEWSSFPLEMFSIQVVTKRPQIIHYSRLKTKISHIYLRNFPKGSIVELARLIPANTLEWIASCKCYKSLLPRASVPFNPPHTSLCYSNYLSQFNTKFPFEFLNWRLK